jgi:hypothetical protein
MILKQHKLERVGWKWVASLPAILFLILGWWLIFHYIFDAGVVGVVIGVSHCLFFAMTVFTGDIRMDNLDTQNEIAELKEDIRLLRKMIDQSDN